MFSEIKITSTMREHCTPLRWLQAEANTKAWAPWGDWSLHPCEMLLWKNSLAVPDKFQCLPSLWSNNPTHRSLTKKKETLKTTLNKNVYKSFSNNQQTLEKTHLSVDWVIHKRSWYIYTMESLFANSRKQTGITGTNNGMNGSQEPRAKETRHRNSTVCMIPFIEAEEWVRSWWHKSKQWLSKGDGN